MPDPAAAQADDTGPDRNEATRLAPLSPSEPERAATDARPGPSGHEPEPTRIAPPHPTAGPGGSMALADRTGADMPPLMPAARADATRLTPPPPPPLSPSLSDTPRTSMPGPHGDTGFERTRLALPPHVLPEAAPDWPPLADAGQPAPAFGSVPASADPLPRPRPRRRVELPMRTRRYGFSLIAFADAMFQLLIFFMLASNLSAFSLLTISGGGGPGEAGSGGAQAATLPGPGLGQTAIWTLSRGGVTAGGQRFELAQITRLAEGASAAGTGQVLLVIRDGAEVQGVVRVLEALARNGITSVQIAAPQLATGAAP